MCEQTRLWPPVTRFSGPESVTCVASAAVWRERLLCVQGRAGGSVFIVVFTMSALSSRCEWLLLKIQNWGSERPGSEGHATQEILFSLLGSVAQAPARGWWPCHWMPCPWGFELACALPCQLLPKSRLPESLLGLR